MKEILPRSKFFILGIVFLCSLVLSASIILFSDTLAGAASSKDNVCTGIGNISGGSGCNNPPGQKTIDGVIQVAVNILSAVVGVASVIMIIISGFKYITAGGDSNSIASAKNTIIYALVGLTIAALAQVIARFVLHRVTS